jgi:hypothetical protein
MLLEKKKQEEERERQLQAEEMLKRKNSVNIPKSILPDVKELVPEPPQPPPSLLRDNSSTSSTDNSDDDTDQDANDEESFAGALDTVVSESTTSLKGPPVRQNFPTPFLMAERRRHGQQTTDLPDPTELVAKQNNKSIAALQEAVKVSKQIELLLTCLLEWITTASYRHRRRK